MRYIVKCVKYFVAFCVLYVALVWIATKSSSAGMDINVWDSIMATMQSERGWMLMAAVVVLSAFYPRFGFMTRKVEGDITEDKEQIVKAFALSGFAVCAESEDEIKFRGDNVVKRAMMLFEDEITVSQYGQWVVLSGNRRGVAKAAYRLEMLMQTKRDETI